MIVNERDVFGLAFTFYSAAHAAEAPMTFNEAFDKAYAIFALPEDERLAASASAALEIFPEQNGAKDEKRDG